MSPTERADFDAWFQRMAKARAYWDQHEDQFTQTYSGQWVAVGASSIVAASNDADELGRALDRLGADRKDLWIRWIPPADAEFVLANYA